MLDDDYQKQTDYHRSRAYRREMKRKKYKRLRKIVTSSYVPHVGFVEWELVDDHLVPVGKYIKYPKNSNKERWIKRETSRKARKYNHFPTKGNKYRRLFDFWWTLY